MFYADLHVHSKFSRATSRESDLEHLAVWAAKKGIAVVATGDFTHPAWFDEVEDKLVPAEPGLYRLTPEREREVARALGRPVAEPVRFMLQVEISTIYKKNYQTRKVHHLVYAPEIGHARRFAESLGRIGNIRSDGRPILGLDSRDLLEIALASGEGCYLVPAHVWTPWFAVLGSKSGFDTIDECYGDLTPEIFALETGLSSDPPMNWRLSALDRYTLVSNSDAHSPPKLGRECCVFRTPLDYFAMRDALRTGEGYGGTVEFFPEEGKYHMDGHRKCGVCLEPGESRRLGGRCPECGKPLTLGVMHRVCELADRAAPPDPLPPRAAPFRSLIPLVEVLGELLGVGPQSKAVEARYEDLVGRLGPELFILEQATLEDVARVGSPLLSEAVRRMREGRVVRQAGYDGEYGVIRLFAADELKRHASVGVLFEMPEEGGEQGADGGEQVDSGQWAVGSEEKQLTTDHSPLTTHPQHHSPLTTHSSHSILDSLDPDQRAAAEAVEGPVLIVAGPGTGKTRTLTHRIAHLVADLGVPPEACLAITFSRRAAAEMSERLERLLPEAVGRVPVMTFHALGLSILKDHPEALGYTGPARVAAEAERIDLVKRVYSLTRRAAVARLRTVSLRKRQFPCHELLDDSEDESFFHSYQSQLWARRWLDFDDLIVRPVRILQENPDLAAEYRRRWRFVSVDEFQDIDAAQYELVRLLAPPGGNLCAIGDPDQAIYGFRGGDAGFFQRFAADYPAARTIALGRNYRSTQTIVDAALQLIAPESLVGDRALEAAGLGPEQIEIHACPTDKAEAELVVHSIERLLGGSTFFSLDSRRAEVYEGEPLAFSDVAVLYRTEAQADALVEALDRSGMPYQRHSHAPLAEQPLVRSVVQAMDERGLADGEPAGLAARLDRALERAAEQNGPSPAIAAALRSLAARCGDDLPRFLSELALGAEVDLWDPRAERIALLTLHAAKGLEFPLVFITGCEDGLLPLRFGPASGQDDRAKDLAEERRLLFVGMTRARERLVLTHAGRRFWRGKVREMPRSPFLADVEERLVALHQHRAAGKRAAPDRQRALFD